MIFLFLTLWTLPSFIVLILFTLYETKYVTRRELFAFLILSFIYGPMVLLACAILCIFSVVGKIYDKLLPGWTDKPVFERK